jgi:hypothetical protein
MLQSASSPPFFTKTYPHHLMQIHWTFQEMDVSSLSSRTADKMQPFSGTVNLLNG